MYETSMQPLSSSENESDDVKVCDICGDAGQEDLLVICSRCIDGAEHVYCMRTMLDRPPVGDWLCEDCKLNEEYENRKAHKFHRIIKIQEESYLDEDAQNARSVICSEIPLKKEEGAVNLEDTVVSIKPQIPELYDENVDVNIHVSEMASTKNLVCTEISVPRKISLSSPEDSFNNRENLSNKTSNPEQSSASCSIFEGQKAHTSSGSISSAGRDSSLVGSGPPLKLSSFKTTHAKPKVKQLLGAVPFVENAIGKLASKTIRKGVLIGQMVKSASFKTGKEGCNRFELDNEKPSVNIKQIEDLCGERDKELSVIGRKNSSKVDLFQAEDTRISRGSVNGDNSGDSIENPLHPSSSSSVLNLEYQTRCQFPEDFQPHDDITKVVTSSITINKPLSSGDQTFRCQKCNEASHPTHLCSIDKHCISAIMLSIDRLPCENANGSNKWKVPGERIISKQAALKCANVTNQSKELQVPSFGYSAKVVNKELPPPCFKKTCFREGRPNATSDFVFDKSEPAVHSHKIHNNLGAGGLNQFGDISKEFKMKSSEQICASTEPCISNTLKSSVIPKLDYFWQGCFEVPRKGRLPECCDGLQAHFSSNASGKVFEAAKEFPPNKLQLEEVHFLSCWPQHFHGNRAKEHNIALFFFARDVNSYRNSYRKLLDNMLKYDLALKGTFRGFELLIFPSYKLSEKSQRWNRLYFLWGIFKEGGQVS